ncbi:DUF6978 family protein [Secundilactobacillus muriivasis]
MDPDMLTDTEVAFLIKSTKEFLNHPVLNAPIIGKYNLEETVADQVNGITYKLHVYRGSLETKYSMHLRFISNNIHLVRICINGARHHNSDGTILTGNHIHIYRCRDGVTEDYAYELDSTPFNKSDDLAKSLEKFIEYVNIEVA